MVTGGSRFRRFGQLLESRRQPKSPCSTIETPADRRKNALPLRRWQCREQLILLSLSRIWIALTEDIVAMAAIERLILEVR